MRYSKSKCEYFFAARGFYIFFAVKSDEKSYKGLSMNNVDDGASGQSPSFENFVYEK